MRPKILVIRGGAIGDFVLTLPAIKLLRDNFPDARIEILGYPHILSLVEGRFYAEAVRSIEYAALAGFFIPNGDLAPDLVEYFSGFQQVVSYLYDPDKFFENNLRRCGVKHFLAIPPVLNESAHACLQLARPLEQLALYLEEPRARLFPTKADRQFATEFLSCANSRPIIAIHPGSGSPKKNWPTRQWIELCQWLLDRQPQPMLLLVGGEADQETVSTLSRELPEDALRIAQNVNLPHLAALLEASALFLGHDSGISHIAAAVGTRSILMYGPTNPSVWGPVGEHVTLVHSKEGDMQKIQPEAIRQEIIIRGI